MNIIPVMHCFDNNYVIPAAIAFLSMLEHANPQYQYKLYVLHTDITPDNQQKLISIVARFKNASLEFVNMESMLDDVFDKIGIKAHYSKEVLYKLLAASLFPLYDKIIITDVDVVFQGDIAKSWEYVANESNFYIAAVKTILRKGTFLEKFLANYEKNFSEKERKENVCCGGYLIFNLKQIRQDNIEMRLLESLKHNAWRILQAEQDIINLEIPMDKRIFLPLNNIVCSYAYDIYSDARYEQDLYYSSEQIADALTHPIQIHYATNVKPWNTPDCTKADIWYYYLSQTPFFYEQMKKFHHDVPTKVKYTLFNIPIITIDSKNVDLFGFIRLQRR